MIEWAMVLGILQNIAMPIIALLGWFIKRLLTSQEQKLNDIYTEVRLTNGRVSRIEEWRVGHEKSVDNIHKNLRDSIASLWARLDGLTDKFNGGR